MWHRIVLFTLMLFPFRSAFATFSVVAIDPESGDLGVAVASRYFAVGAVVPWAEANVGAVATQANVNVGYGARAIELLRQGRPASQVLDQLLEEDTFEGKGGRQFAIVDAKGQVAVFTGAEAQDWKGHKRGATYSVQGNLLAGPQVLDAMARAFENTRGELAERLYAALKAGDEAGGDRRGRQSAAMLVVRKRGGRNTNNDRYVFVNVDDHPEPMRELRRLLDLQLAINHSGQLTKLLREGKLQRARVSAEKVTQYAPNQVEAHMNLGFLWYLTGDPDKALSSFRKARELSPNFEQSWETMVARPAYQKVAKDRDFVNKVLGSRPPR